jgi:chromosome segregation ATPase
MELSELKAKMLALLKVDEEFRYAVAGMIGYDEILKRLQKHDEKFEELLSTLKRHEEILETHSKQIARLQEDFNEMLAQIKEIRESQARLEKRVDSLEQHLDTLGNRIDSLEKHVKNLDNRINSLEKHVDKLDNRVASLETHVSSLEERVDSLASAMIAGFAEISKFAGITFEEFVRKFLTASLKKLGQIPQGAELTRTLIDGEEVNIFLEDPLIVGEVTAHAETAQEVQKLARAI